MSAREARFQFSTLFALIFAGEMVFSLPFHVARYFRPSVLEGFGLSNSELGDVFAFYGVTAMLSYFPGGVVADRFSASTLMCWSLIATAVGGAYMATFPTYVELTWLYGYWGVTTIFLFWAAMIRATRGLGGSDAQGRAFGILDGGRGLAAAVAASVAVEVFARVIGEIPDGVTASERRTALSAVMLFYTGATLAAAWLVWRNVPHDDVCDGDDMNPRASFAGVFGRRDTWLQAAIVVCAYCGYKGLDNYALYAVDVLGLSEVDAARFTATSAYVRPVAALAAGLVADRVRAANVILASFVVLTAAYLLLGVLVPTPTLGPLVYGDLLVTFVGVFGLRGVYFALLQETSVPLASTGRAVGLISFVGFTPDVFFAPLAGRLLDSAPGIAGHQRYFLLLAAIAGAGAVVAMALSGRRSPTAIAVAYRAP